MTLRLYLDEDSSDLDLLKAGEQTHRWLRLINTLTAEDMQNGAAGSDSKRSIPIGPAHSQQTP